MASVKAKAKKKVKAVKKAVKSGARRAAKLVQKAAPKRARRAKASLAKEFGALADRLTSLGKSMIEQGTEKASGIARAIARAKR